MGSEKVQTIDDVAKKIIATLNEAGFQAYIVGGAVRDKLLNKPVNDIDLATDATPTEVTALFEHVIPVGIEHGTVIVRADHLSFEVTTFREEAGYSDFRHPDEVSYVTDLTTDLSRRDFTMNAMAENKQGTIIDPFDGKADLQARLIRAVGEPLERFQEDPLRILRALRFASQLGFMIETNTYEAMQTRLPLITALAIERVRVELDKLIQAENCRMGLHQAEALGLFDYLPVFKDSPSLIMKVRASECPFNGLTDWFVYLAYLEKHFDLSTFIKAYKLSNKDKQVMNDLYDTLMFYQSTGVSDRLVYQLDKASIHRFCALVFHIFGENLSPDDLLDQKQALPIQSRQELAVDGHDLRRLLTDKAPGPWLRELIGVIEQNVVSGSLPNKKRAIEEWVKWYYQSENA